MSTDIAGLSFAIDSGPVVNATAELDKLARQAAVTGTSARDFATTTTDARRALQDLAQQATLNEAALRQTGQGLDGLLGKIQNLSREVTAFQATTKDLTTALGQLRATGDLFGTSAVGIDNFVRASRSIGQTSYETVNALQRITQALEGTTVAGERARRVLREYGVETEGRGTDQGGQVLREFVTRLRQTRPDSLRNDDVAAVLGQQSIETLATINNPAYQTIEQRRRQAQADAGSASALQVRLSVSERAQDTQRREAERADLQLNFATFGEDLNPFGGTSNLQELRGRRDSGARPNTQRLRIQQNPDGSAAFQGPEGVGPNLDALMATLGLRSGQGGFGAARDIWGYYNSESFGALQSDISQRRDEEREQNVDTNGWFPGLGPRVRAVGRRARSALGGYVPNRDLRTNPELERTINFDRDSDTYLAQSSLRQNDVSDSQGVIAALRGFGNVNTDGFDRLGPTEILQRLRDNNQGWAATSVQRRFDSQDAAQANQASYQREDRGLIRRAESGGLRQQDLFNLSPDSLGLSGNPLTDQEAAERARTIGQAILRIRETFKGEEARAAELTRVAGELDADQQQRRQIASARADQTLSTTLNLRTIATDVNPANAANNAFASTLARELASGTDATTANTRATQALTEATISLERASNETIRQGRLGLADSVNELNSLGANPRFTRQTGAALDPLTDALQGRPRGATVAATDENISRLLGEAANRYGVPEDALRAVAETESRSRQYGAGGRLVTSPVGALGVMQLMPGTADGLGVDPRNPAANIDGGSRYFGNIASRFAGTPNQYEAAWAGYNWGPGYAPSDDRSQSPNSRYNVLRRYAETGNDSELPRETREGLGRFRSYRAQFGQRGGDGGDGVDVGAPITGATAQDLLRGLLAAGASPNPSVTTLPEITVTGRRRAAPPPPANENGFGVVVPEAQGYTAPGDSSRELLDRIYSPGRARYGTERRVDQQVAGGRLSADRRDEAIGLGGQEEATRALSAYLREVERGTLTHRNALESLTATTSAERELITARQQGNDRAAQLRQQAAQSSDPETRRRLLTAAEQQAPSDGSRGLPEQNAAGTFPGRLQQIVTSRERTLEDEQREAGNWWMTNANRAAARGEQQARRQAADLQQSGTPLEDQLVRASAESSRLSEISRQNQLLRDSFLDVGNAATAALSQIIIKGGDARQVVAQLASTLASSLLNRATTGLAEKGFEALGSLFTGRSAGSSSPASSGDSGSGVFSAIGSGLSAAGGAIRSFFGFAQGGMTDGRGGVAEHPTYFPMAGGAMGLMGEAGGDAILPLRRDSSGRLGVGGGGGGGTNNVTINVTNNGPGAVTSGDQAKNIAKEVQKAWKEMHSAELMQEQRVGGMLNPL